MLNIIAAWLQCDRSQPAERTGLRLGLHPDMHHRLLRGSSWSAGSHQSVRRFEPHRIISTLTRASPSALFATGFAGYIILIASKSPGLSYFATYLAASCVLRC